jgi:hypothetical protein
MTAKKLIAIENRIRRVKESLQNIGEMRPGSLSQQSHDPEKRRVYWQLSYTYKMKSRSEYIRDQFVKDTKKQIENYKRFRSLIDQWLALAIEHAKLKMSPD